MHLSRLIIIIVLTAVISFSQSVFAQKSGSALNTEVNTNLPNNTTGAITPAILRSTLIDIINSILTSAGCPSQVLGFDATGVTPQCYAALSGNLGSISVKVRSSSLTSVIAAATSDYFLCLDPTSNTITVTLPSSPILGQTFLVKDCTGQAQTHNITIVPGTGTIDGSVSSIMTANYQSEAITFTGSQWSIN